MKIAFHANHLNYGGVNVAQFDYARFNKEILGNESYILYNRDSTDNIGPVVKKALLTCPMIPYEGQNDLNYLLDRNKIDKLYAIKYGTNDGFQSAVCDTLVHAVFDITQPHGDRYAAISRWLADNKVPYVPHMIRPCETKTDMRPELNIPADAVVFGRHGSYGSFDIEFVKDTINIITNENNNIYFLFLNTEPFDCNNDKVIFFEATDDRLSISRYISSCNAMIHARQRGETFGLSCGEFSIQNKPVITYTHSPELAHLDMLGSKAVLYSNKQELYKILTSFPDWYKKDFDYNAYRDYSPEKVMQKFKEVFL